MVINKVVLAFGLNFLFLYHETKTVNLLTPTVAIRVQL